MARRKQLKINPNISKTASSQQTDAFKLMMDSRNKSKEITLTPDTVKNNNVNANKTIDNCILNEKRNLSSNDINEEEELFTNNKKKLLKKATLKIKLDNKREISSDGLVQEKSKKIIKLKKFKKTSCTISPISIIEEIETIDIEKVIENESAQPTDDKGGVPEVMKENIFSYFKKIDQSVECKVKDNNDFFNHEASFLESNAICLDIGTHDEIKTSNDQEIKNIEGTDSLSNETKPFEKRKRKWKTNSDRKIYDDKLSNMNEPKEVTKGRPKRNVKKPLKYIDHMCSSDEDELFTPKKRKQVEKKDKKNIKQIKQSHDSPMSEDQKDIPSKKNKKVELTTENKKTTKLAPIFKTKMQLTPEESNAKQKFLQSGFPEQLKKNRTPLVKCDTQIHENLTPVVHIQQKKHMTHITNVDENRLIEAIDDDDNESDYEKKYLPDNTKLLKLLTSVANFKSYNNFSMKKNSFRELLQDMKEAYPEFPIFRTYNTLKSRRRESGNLLNQCIDNRKSNNNVTDLKISSKYLTWTDKYKATSTNNIMGNVDIMKELKKWLMNWTETEINGKKYSSNSSDLSDFCDSDTSVDFAKLLNNLVILSGPTGSGKTSSIYAVASELAIKVIEVNVSSKRTGKSMLQDLREATQSHKVNRHSNIFTKSVKLHSSKISKTSKNTLKLKNKNSSRDSSMLSEGETVNQGQREEDKAARTCMSLILIDDADIVFEEDDGFASAITQLVYSSKRPVVLTMSSTDCPHLQRFLHHSKVLHMRPYYPKKLGIWLDILCVVDIGFCWPGLGYKVLNNLRGDIRKAINYLQFYMTAQKQISSELVSQNKEKHDYPNNENNTEQERCKGVEAAISQCVLGSQPNYGPVNLFHLWWNIPHILPETFSPDRIKMSEKSHIAEMNALSTLIDTISITDYFKHKIKPDNKASLISEPWKLFESDSVSELEDKNMFNSIAENYNDIIEELVMKSVSECQKALLVKENTYRDPPEMTVQHEKDGVVSRHLNLNSVVHPASALDRRALALDYWPACRSLCRIEDNNVKVTSKRHNRYCHYLKTLNASCKNDYLNQLGESLS